MIEADLSGLAVVPPTSIEDSQLTSVERAYAYWRGCGLSPAQSLRRTGDTSSDASRNQARQLRLESDPRIKAVILRIYEENRIRYEIDRDRVVEGLMEAINVAREQSDAQNMISGWKELAKITGVGAPERKEIVLSQGNLSNDQLRQVSDEDLLRLVGKERTLALPSTIEDVEYTHAESIRLSP